MLPTKTSIAKAMVFLIVMYACENWTIKEGWAPNNLCFWIVVLEKTLESSLDCKEIKPVNPNRNQPWIFIGRTNAEAEASMPYHMMQRFNSLEKPLMMGKIESRRRRGWWRMRLFDGIIRLSGHEFEQALGNDGGQTSLVCCSPWDFEESDITGRLNNNSVLAVLLCRMYYFSSIGINNNKDCGLWPCWIWK